MDCGQLASNIATTIQQHHSTWHGCSENPSYNTCSDPRPLLSHDVLVSKGSSKKKPHGTVQCEIPIDSFAVCKPPSQVQPRPRLCAAAGLGLVSAPDLVPSAAASLGPAAGAGHGDLGAGGQCEVHSLPHRGHVITSTVEAGDCNTCVQEGGSAGADILSQFGTLFGKSPVTSHQSLYSCRHQLPGLRT